MTFHRRLIMTEQRNPPYGWFARWRRHQRARRQEALEREFFVQERARSGEQTSSASIDVLNASTRANAQGTFAMAFLAGLSGGDGG
jgi:hypothetical protein